jgi:hypothetical protein
MDRQSESQQDQQFAQIYLTITEVKKFPYEKSEKKVKFPSMIALEDTVKFSMKIHHQFIDTD